MVSIVTIDDSYPTGDELRDALPELPKPAPRQPYTPTEGGGSTQGATNRAANAGDGERHALLLWAASAMAREGVGVEEIEAAVCAAAVANGAMDKYGEKEVLRLVSDGIKYGGG